ncbi:MAG: sugar transferase [Candidatus Omnitrophica bacterium]|nr:sugar transferase [Candidatus Omnitrophota bacterium]
MVGLYRRGGKRIFDLLLSSAGLLFFALPMVWIGWRISREKTGAVFFRQLRIGYRGKLFTILKFRTLGEGNVSSNFSKILRWTAMDELPQLFNILKGDMSFVGPRPLIQKELEDLRRIPEGMDRLSVRPGLTGLAQLNSDKIPSLEERLGWDLAYVRQHSFLLDIRILLMSVFISIRGEWEKPAAKRGIL